MRKPTTKAKARWHNAESKIKQEATPKLIPQPQANPTSSAKLPPQSDAEMLLYLAVDTMVSNVPFHGDKIISFGHIATFWNAYLAARQGGISAPITATNVAQMLEMLKIARSICGSPETDHFLDAAGYAAIAYEVQNASK